MCVQFWLVPKERPGPNKDSLQVAQVWEISSYFFICFHLQSSSRPHTARAITDAPHRQNLQAWLFLDKQGDLHRKAIAQLSAPTPGTHWIDVCPYTFAFWRTDHIKEVSSVWPPGITSRRYACVRVTAVAHSFLRLRHPGWTDCGCFNSNAPCRFICMNVWSLGTVDIWQGLQVGPCWSGSVNFREYVSLEVGIGVSETQARPTYPFTNPDVELSATVSACLPPCSPPWW